MNKTKYQYILYFIVAVILVTIGIQVYWNYNNYLNQRKQLVNEVQISLDNAVDDYYADLAERSTFGIFLEGDAQKNTLEEGSEVSNILKSLDSIRNGNKNFGIDRISVENIENVTVLKGLQVDSMERLQTNKSKTVSKSAFKKRIDSLKEVRIATENVKDLEILTSKIIVSINNDTLDLKEVDRLLQLELKRKEISINHQLKFEVDSLTLTKEDITSKDKTVAQQTISTSSKSTFLPEGSALTIYFNNITYTLLKRSFSGILISLVLVLAIISCLFYLLQIIKDQKELAEMKNDLISNITHEFKTPIATISAALEGLGQFNAIEDKAKTQKYIGMSQTQLIKLNTMVEKILETATLDSEELELKKEKVDLAALIEEVFKRYEIQHPEKEFEIQLEANHYSAMLDLFHFENAVNNIFDNAMKYGGSKIYVEFNATPTRVEIKISDNGQNLTKANKERIFEKFYRVPQGNTHNVKGFGIGLFYTKTIIEKHDGTIAIDLSNNLTTFKITLPNG